MADKTVEEYRAEQQAEYSTFKALLPIFHDGARAYNPGDPVPTSNVELHGYEVGVQVERVGDTPAAEPTTDASTQPVNAQPTPNQPPQPVEAPATPAPPVQES